MVRAAIICVGLAFAVLWSWLLVQHIGSRSIIANGSALARGVSITEDEIDKFTPLDASLNVTCRRDIQDAAMRLRLGILEARLQGNSSVDQLDEAYRRATSTTERYLACFPLASDPWMRSAMTSMRMEGPIEKVFSRVELSQLTGPREAWVLSSRVPFLMSLRQTEEPRVIDALNRDLDTLFRDGQLSQVRRIYGEVGPYGKSLMQDRLNDANLDVLTAKDPEKLDRLLSVVDLKISGEDCARYFHRLKACVGER